MLVESLPGARSSLSAHGMKERRVSIIKARPNRVRSVPRICRLLEPNRDALVLYARLIGDSADYAVNELIETTLANDRDFVARRRRAPAREFDRSAAISRAGARRGVRTEPRL